MGETLNIANAALILGAIYLNLVYHLDIVVTVLVIALAVGSWSYHGFSKERKEYFAARIRLAQAKADYYRRKTQ